jgi:hypothetical protein
MIYTGEFATEFELFVAVSPGQEAVITDAVKTVGKHVQQKTANELIRREAHDAGAAVAAIVFVGQAVSVSPLRYMRTKSLPQANQSQLRRGKNSGDWKMAVRDWASKLA